MDSLLDNVVVSFTQLIFGNSYTIVSLCTDWHNNKARIRHNKTSFVNIIANAGLGYKRKSEVQTNDFPNYRFMRIVVRLRLDCTQLRISVPALACLRQSGKGRTTSAR